MIDIERDLFVGAGCWNNATHPTLVKNLTRHHDEKMVERNWLLRRDGAFRPNSVCSTGGSVFGRARSFGPKLVDTCSTDIANARGYAHC